jgi:hypothetical protein
MPVEKEGEFQRQLALPESVLWASVASVGATEFQVVSGFDSDLFDGSWSMTPNGCYHASSDCWMSSSRDHFDLTLEP